MRARTGLILAALSAVVAGLLAPTTSALAQSVAQNGIVSENPAGFTPNVLDGKVEAIAQIGSTVYLGGSFTQVQDAAGDPAVSRSNVVAFDATTGEISTTFAPVVDGEVTALAAAADGRSIYVGGFFSTVNGAKIRKLARLSVSDGSPVAGFKAAALDGAVKDLRLLGGRLWVAGTFATVGGQAQPALATMDAATGAFDPYMSLQLGAPYRGGVLQVAKEDITGDGSRLVAIGNFGTVNGSSRPQLALLDLTGPAAQLADWSTQMYAPDCASAFDTYMRDVDFAPDGSFFVVSTTGAYGGSTSPCDSTMRWETRATGTVSPTWVDYTGGDTTYAVAVTGGAVYVGGHVRWENNAFSGDAAGPGAVAREGIAALDPANGLPFSWNPGRTRGVGVFDMLATPTGLWVGSDTDRIGNYEYHGRIAFFPLAGGTPAPTYSTGGLPGHVFLTGAPAAAAGVVPGSVLYRVNAGGGSVPSSDGGPDWSADTALLSRYRSFGSSTSTYGPVGSVNASVPSTTPPSIFDSERWDPAGLLEMQWAFPVPAGTPIEVRLYFANRYSGTSRPGQRVFNVALDRRTVLGNYDIAADAGNNVGTMKAFDITSDGTVNIDFGHVKENPLIDGIEIVRTDLKPPPAAGGTDDLRDVFSDGTTALPAQVRSGTGVPWGTARGSVMINGSVYTAYGDGSFTRRTFDGTTFGAPVAVDGSDQIVRLDAWHTDAGRITGMFFDSSRLYYTVVGSSALYYRYFTPQDDVVGALRYTASTGVAGVDFSKVSGMFLAGGKLYFGSATDGTLGRIDWAGGAPVAGTQAVVGGPRLDGNDWRSNGMFLYTGNNLPAPIKNQPPVAVFTSSCGQLSCTFDASASTDAEGPVAGYAWDFGDGSTATGPTASHAYGASGSYPVRLTVTDGVGATGSATGTVTPTAVVAAVGTSSTNGNATGFTVTVPPAVSPGDALVLVVTTATTVTATPPGPDWTQVATVSMGGTNGGTTVWQKVATAGDAGTAVKVTLSAITKTGVTLLAYTGTSATPVAAVATAAEAVSQAAHTTPAVSVAGEGSVVVSFWADRTGATTTWTAPAGEVVRDQTAGIGGGHISTLVTDSGGPVPTGTRAGLTATADSASAKATMISLVLARR